MSRTLRLMYLAGTQDPAAALRHLGQGEHDPDALFVPYVRQFLQVCEDLGAQGIVVSSRPPRRRLQLDRYVFHYLPHPSWAARGRRYELGQVLYGLVMAALCLLHRPHVVFVGDGMMHYRTIQLLRLSGARIVLSFHNTLWTRPSSAPDRWQGIARRNSVLFRRTVSAIMCASDDIANNFEEVTGGRCRPVTTFLPTFRDGVFDDVAASAHGETFTVLFVGRTMPEKGIFDMLRIAELLCERGLTNLKVIMCGEGWADRMLAEAIEDRRLGQVVDQVGQLDAAAMLERYASANVVVVPTRTSFREGFNHVVAEAVLCKRAVITSEACPAVRYFDEGIILAQADSPESYADAVWDEFVRQENGQTSAACIEPPTWRYDLSRGWYGRAIKAITHAADEESRIPFRRRKKDSERTISTRRE